MMNDNVQDYESARLEHCPKCNSTAVRNNVYFCKGKRVKVYVQCDRCGEYIARYTLTGYTSNEPYESLLRKLRFTRLTSGKRTKRIVEEFSEGIEKEFRHVLQLIRTKEDERRMEEIIEEDYPESLE
ncbi:MAG: hypothetical protein JSV33_05525 [bacterium]|nr:MAG: hypothetical protein JSV33_05525 [bacterium]